ncbi:MAG: aminotransferase class I/II-fold pyridoxal phosphate-dependent enzyme [Christensenellales bacterium]|jgi:aminotransferase|nr:aminotransferase class I/II-fold pyridoxal phosphate-dependent enzyme [Clostridia bacterium]HRU84757.1 aminotransferase class I/II-fold pyridoxal phosphate-dependent enzyme [Eubacteriales bacterium]
MDYSKVIGKAAAAIPPSGIRKFFDIAAEMKDCISLGVGEPDFITPESFRAAALASINAGKTQYTSNSGLAELRAAISEYQERAIGIKYNPSDEILITVGASEAIDLALRAIINPGDEVLVPAPSYVSYTPCVTLAGGIPVVIDTKAENEFKLTPEELKAAITDKTKALILPYPNNPTGGIMERKYLEAIAPIIKERGLIVLSDEIYSELTYGNERHVSIAELDGMRELTILLNGFSKAFAMTGWRVGYACAPKELLAVMRKIHQYCIMCAPTASQYTALAALTESFKNNFAEVKEMCAKYDERRRYLVDRLNAIGLSCFEPKGAFYAFPSVASTGLTGEQFAEKLLFAKKVAVVPGSAFGASGKNFVRISYAYSVEKIKTALDRIEEFLKELKA